MKITRQELDQQDLSNFITSYRSLNFNEIFKIIVTKNEFKSSKYENLMHDIFMGKYKNTNLVNLMIMRDFISYFINHYNLEETEFSNYLKSIEFELSKLR